MAILNAFLPVEQGVACYASLKAHTDARKADGDARSRDQIMADTLVERLTGQTTADQVNAEIHITCRRGSQPAPVRRMAGQLIKLRDQYCRDPYCTALICHIDHIRRYTEGGPTTLTNGRRVCERHNHTREMPGWQIKLIDIERRSSNHNVVVTTPTGHHYLSRPPPRLDS